MIPAPLFFSIQWIISELACYTYSMVAVPLYDTLGPEALVFIINRGNENCFLASLEVFFRAALAITPADL